MMKMGVASALENATVKTIEKIAEVVKPEMFENKKAISKWWERFENNTYQSTCEERFKQMPQEVSVRGKWESVRGESKYIPSDWQVKALLGKYSLDGIEYHKTIPDLSKCSESTVEINQMSEKHAKNFEQCDQKCANQWSKDGKDGKNDWTARDVTNWRKGNEYSWHERDDLKTCDLVPDKINDYFGHFAGVEKLKARIEVVETEITENNAYNSTLEERINQTPKEVSDRGSWKDLRGESKFIPFDEEIKQILNKYDLEGIRYHMGIPDFEKCSEATVQIDRMSENRPKNFEQCDQKCAEQWNKEGKDGQNDWIARDVANWRKENGCSWHECNDMKTCNLIPTKINDYFGHFGGVGECKRADKGDAQGDGFDE